jgi:hypothetical protein
MQLQVLAYVRVSAYTPSVLYTPCTAGIDYSADIGIVGHAGFNEVSIEKTHADTGDAAAHEQRRPPH